MRIVSSLEFCIFDAPLIHAASRGTSLCPLSSKGLWRGTLRKRAERLRQASLISFFSYQGRLLDGGMVRNVCGQRQDWGALTVARGEPTTP